MKKKLIVAHQNPDLDAIGCIWLLIRFNENDYKGAEVAFVPAGKKIEKVKLSEIGIEKDEVTHVDTGGGEFDDHTNTKSGESSSVLVFNYLKNKYKHLKDDRALEKVVAFINKTDHFEQYFWPEPDNDRYMFMLEQILNGYKLGGHGNDEEVVTLGKKCLDGVYSMTKILIEAKEELKQGIEFETRWGKAIGILSSNDSVIKLGQKLGYNVVIRKDPQLGNLRIKAAPLSEIDLTPVFDKIREQDKLGTWYFHPGKHMLINGSRKHLGQKPSPLTLESAIKIVGGV